MATEIPGFTNKSSALKDCCKKEFVECFCACMYKIYDYDLTNLRWENYCIFWDRHVFVVLINLLNFIHSFY